MNAKLKQGHTTMSRLAATALRIVPMALRVSLCTLLLAAPVLAFPLSSPHKGTVLEAPAPKNIGAGLVLLVSLQRA